MANHNYHIKFWTITACCLIALSYSSYSLTKYYLNNKKISYYKDLINKKADFTDYFAFHLEYRKYDVVSAAEAVDVDGGGGGAPIVYCNKGDTLFEDFNKEFKKFIGFWRGFQNKPVRPSDAQTFDAYVSYYADEISTLDSINTSLSNLVETIIKAYTIYDNDFDNVHGNDYQVSETQLSITLKSLNKYKDYSDKVISPTMNEVRNRLLTIKSQLERSNSIKQYQKELNKAFDPLQSLKDDAQFYYHMNDLMSCFVGFEKIAD